MFGFLKKTDFEKIFSSSDETYKYIYGDRSKTAGVLGDNKFIKAWINSEKIESVSSVIRKEALKGDIPSLKQMIWLADLYFNNSENLTRDKAQQMRIKVESLEDRIMLCEKAMNLGLKDQSYYAMASCVNLYSILAPQQKNVTDERTRKSLDGIVKYAKLFIDSGNNDPELISDAREILKHYAPLAIMINAFNH